MKKFSLILVSVILALSLQAQIDNPFRWSFEAELIQPFVPTVEIFNIQATRTIFENTKQKGELVIGAYIRPNVEHDVVEEIDEHMLYVAYRHFLWRGFHAEAGMNTGYYWGWKNLVDGRDYEGIGMYWEANIGYKWNVGKSNRFFVNPQFGAVGTMGLSDIGPRNGKTDNFVQGNLFLGVNF